MHAAWEITHLAVSQFAGVFTLGFGQGPYLPEGVEELVAHRLPAFRATGQGSVDCPHLAGSAEGTKDAAVVVVGHSLSPLRRLDRSRWLPPPVPARGYESGTRSGIPALPG